MVNRILCRLFGHRTFEKTWLLITTDRVVLDNVDGLLKEGEFIEKKEYVGRRCPRCGAWEHSEINIRFATK